MQPILCTNILTSLRFANPLMSSPGQPLYFF